MFRAGRLHLMIAVAAILSSLAACDAAGDPLDACNVTWAGPSRDSGGSMPLGNGDIGVNLWVEQDGDLLVLLSKTDAWSGNGRLLKLGRMRVSLSPNPFVKDAPFSQTLRLRQGEVHVAAGAGEAEVAIHVWVDANRPVVHVDADAKRPVAMTAKLEVWRTQRRELPKHERFSAYGMQGGPQPVMVEPDTVLPPRENRIVWYHRNAKSCYPITMKVQALGDLLDKFPDPLLGRTFGGCIRGEGLVTVDDTTLRSAQPARRQQVAVYPLTAQTKTAAEWRAMLEKSIAAVDAVARERAVDEHRRWWRQFWDRSWVYAATPTDGLAALTAGAGRIQTNKLPLRIGSDPQGRNRFIGQIARAGVYRTALSGQRLAALAARGPGAAVEPADGLVAAWRFDKADGGAFKNRAGEGLDAKIVGQVGVVDAGQCKAIDLTGKGYLEVAHDARLDLTDAMTLEAWIRPGKLPPSGGRLIDKAPVATANGYLLDTFPGRSLRLITTPGIVSYPANFTPGQWVHVAGTFDAKTGGPRLYVGGKPVKPTPWGGKAGAGGADVVTRGYTLQRYINACGGRGAYPIKFNGSIFTVDGPRAKPPYDADYRAWGGCYWFQNTRLPYWSMLSAGDFDLMGPLFAMYRAALPLARARTRTYYQHDGAYFPETMYFWGTYNNNNYGWNRKGKPHGRTDNTYIRYYWQGGIELSTMMLDYYALTAESRFAAETLLPFVTEILTFFDQHWKRGKDGKIRFEPAASLETWHTAVDPAPEIAGLSYVLGRLLKLPAELVDAQRLRQWKRLLADLPDLPTAADAGKKHVLPARTFSNRRNSENPELYAVWPYRVFGLTGGDVEVGRLTFRKRRVRRTGGWSQDAIQAACLGLRGEAARDVHANFSRSNPGSRFPAFWGPNFDWVPDQDHGCVAMIALQRMLIQADGRKILLLPAWPGAWDVDFKLHAPDRTTVHAVYRKGRLEKMDVTPSSRAKDVIVMPPKPPGHQASQ